MSPCLEFEGKNVEKASEKACEELKISKEKLKYDVISYGATGIFGLVGIKKAKIRVTLPDLIPEDNSNGEDIEHNNQPKEHVADIEHNNQLKEHVADIECSIKQTQVDDKEIVPISDESVNLGKDILQQIINLITTDSEISVEKKSEQILFYIKGGKAALLIGKRGQTLEAIQYLVEKVINKNSEQRIRIQIDVEGYLEKRQSNLKALAIRLAEKTKRSGKPVTIGQMNAHDRRIVHLTLRDNGDVRTQSIGGGFLKKLLIFPSKKYSRKKNQT